jgi:hypothetical protein
LRPENGRQCLGEGARAAVLGVVEEVLLGLVEDEVDIPRGLRLPERRDRRAIDGASGRVPDRLGEGHVRIVAPAGEDDHERLLRQLP